MPAKFTAKRRLRMIARLVQKHGAMCHLCGLVIDLKVTNKWRVTLDHIIPRVEGGGNHIKNLKLAHHFCNTSRGHMSVDDYLLQQALGVKLVCPSHPKAPQVTVLDNGRKSVLPSRVQFQNDLNHAIQEQKSSSVPPRSGKQPSLRSPEFRELLFGSRQEHVVASRLSGVE